MNTLSQRHGRPPENQLSQHCHRRINRGGGGKGWRGRKARGEEKNRDMVNYKGVRYKDGKKGYRDGHIKTSEDYVEVEIRNRIRPGVSYFL